MIARPNFYSIDAKLSYGRSPVKIKALTEYETLEHLSEKSPLKSTNKFTVDSGKKWYDVVQFADSFHFAISKRVKKILEEHQMAGWGCFPIEILNEPDRRYFAFFVTSVAGKLQNLEALNNYETERHEFDITTWDGVDFFTNKETLLLNCTERVKDILIKNKVTNIEIKDY